MARWSNDQQLNDHRLFDRLYFIVCIGEVIGIYRPSRGRSANEEVTLCTIGMDHDICFYDLGRCFYKTNRFFARSTIAMWYIVAV